ncbi:MAG: hypothetical protein QM621_13335 [Aeromicrobium sp.]|uniref:hypothetical protein n=1 Tax=Aeromicrobium sp. TaxID=1871063 RepID=UPI0039E4BC44
MSHHPDSDSPITPPLPLAAYLPDDYLPVYGASLTPESLIARSAFVSTVTALNAQGETVEYELVALGGEQPSALCQVDGVRQTYTDPHSKVVVGDVAHPAEWFDWIARQDAAGHLSRRADAWYDSDEIERALRRAEFGIVAYAEEETACRNFASLEEFRVWLGDHLTATQVRATVAAVTRFPVGSDGKPRTEQFLRTWGSEAPVRWAAYVMSTDHDPADWLTPPPDRYQPRPWITLNYSGAELLHSETMAALPWSELAEHATLDHTDGSQADWWALTVEGTDYTLVFPRQYANVYLYTDGDGAHVTLSILPTERRTEDNRRRDRFERRWGSWLDDEAVLTDEEIGVAVAEAALTAALAAESEEH